VAGVGLRRHEERLRALELELGAAFAGFSLEEDSTAGWDAALGVVESRLGSVSGAALVAGGWRGGRLFHEDRGEGTWQSMLDENLESAQRALRVLLPRLVAQRSGSVVVVGSATSNGRGPEAAPSPTRLRRAPLSRSRARSVEVPDAGVRVNAVLPSTIDTPRTAQRWRTPTWHAGSSLSRSLRSSSSSSRTRRGM
jgi:NAD(P)-dependent dehydrogenase (short-subunit alcohol dehydrogenase family)